MFVASLATLVILSALTLPRLGAWLQREDPLEPADAIVVLGGTMYERQLEAVDLYKAGYAPRVFISRELIDWGERELIERGIAYPRPVDIQIDVMTRVGMPREAIGILDAANSTAEEADHVLALATHERFSRIIIVTSKQHTRRSRLVMNRRLATIGARAIVRASKYDRSDLEHWWRDRSTLRFTLFETQRLIAYWMRIAD